MSARPPNEGQAAAPSPPLDDGASVSLTILLDRLRPGEESETDLVRRMAQHLPRPDILQPCAWIAVVLAPARRRRIFGKAQASPEAIEVQRAACCTALLAVGYEHVCADGSGTAFGRVPAR